MCYSSPTPTKTGSEKMEKQIQHHIDRVNSALRESKVDLDNRADVVKVLRQCAAPLFCIKIFNTFIAK